MTPSTASAGQQQGQGERNAIDSNTAPDPVNRLAVASCASVPASVQIRVAIYLRVSKREEQTCLNQEADCIRYARAQGWDYEIYSESESSRRTRPIKEQVLNMIRQGEFNGVVVWRLDRWGRSITELVLELEEFQQRGYIFASVKENIDLTSASGTLFAHLLSAFAQFERSLIRERTRAGLDRAEAEGKILGRPPGSKDRRPRRRSGYWRRWSKQSSPIKPATSQRDELQNKQTTDNLELESKKR